MSTSIDLNRPVWQLTVGELIDLVQRASAQATPTTTQPEALPIDRYVYGIDGLARLFGCSKTTANKIKSSGTIDKAIKQTGRKIVIDAPLALQLVALKK